MTASGRVRRATVSDAPELVRLGGTMYVAIGMSLTEEWRSRVFSDIERRLGVDLWGWVIDGEEDGTLAACALLDRHPRLAPPGEEASWRGYVQWVATDPPYRRRGYARALMMALMRWAADQGVKVVELNASDEGRPLYESLGYGPPRGLALRVDLRDIVLDQGDTRAQSPNA
jgi:GNAT superfamily N-acetyltransferase